MVVTQPDSRRESFNVSQRYAEIGMKAVERALQFHAMDADADGQLVIDDLVQTLAKGMVERDRTRTGRC